jgi:WD40 repeat protein
LSENGLHVATGSDDETARLWSGTTGTSRHVLAGHTSRVVHTEFSRDATRLATAAHDGTTRIWNVETGAPVRKLEHARGSIAFAVFSLDGKNIATASGDQLTEVWDLSLPMAKPVRLEHDCLVHTASFDGSSSRIATGCGTGSVTVWDARTGAQLFSFMAPSKTWMRSVSFNRDGTRLIARDQSRFAYLIDGRDGELIGRLDGKERADAVPDPGRAWGRIVLAGFSHDGRRVLTACDNGSVHIWDAETAGQIATFESNGGAIESALFSSDEVRSGQAVQDWGTGAPQGCPRATVSGRPVPESGGTV